MICAWIDTSSAETGSSHTRSFGLDREASIEAISGSRGATESFREDLKQFSMQ